MDILAAISVYFFAKHYYSEHPEWNDFKPEKKPGSNGHQLPVKPEIQLTENSLEKDDKFKEIHFAIKI